MFQITQRNKGMQHYEISLKMFFVSAYFICNLAISFINFIGKLLLKLLIIKEIKSKTLFIFIFNGWSISLVEGPCVPHLPLTNSTSIIHSQLGVSHQTPQPLSNPSFSFLLINFPLISRNTSHSFLSFFFLILSLEFFIHQ